MVVKNLPSKSTVGSDNFCHSSYYRFKKQSDLKVTVLKLLNTGNINFLNSKMLAGHGVGHVCNPSYLRD
jgi:hypothetical protein